MEPARYFSQKSRQCLVHTGFQERYEVYRENLLNEIKNIDFDEILVTGHSLGAALATFCYMELSQQHKLKLSLRDYVKINLITFGSPRIGNINLQKAMRVKAKSIGRFVTPHDPVPSSPPNEKDSGCSWYVLASLMKLVTPKDYHHIADPIQIPLTEDAQNDHWFSWSEHAMQYYTGAIVAWEKRTDQAP